MTHKDKANNWFIAAILVSLLGACFLPDEWSPFTCSVLVFVIVCDLFIIYHLYNCVKEPLDEKNSLH